MVAPTLIKRNLQKSYVITDLPLLFNRCQTMQIAKKQNLEKLIKWSLSSAEYSYILWLIK